MKKIADLFTTVCFAAFLFLAMAATVLREPAYSSFYENRDLAAFPELTTEGATDGALFAALEAWLSDHTAGRTTLLKIKTKLDMDVFSRPVVNTVVVTDDNLLQFNEFGDVDEAAVRREAAALTENLKSLEDLVSGYGGACYYVAVPNQYAVRGDQYPWYLNNLSAFFEAEISALSEALEEAGVGFIDIGEAYKAAGTPDYLTSAVDNHFTVYGAFLAYQAILDRVNADTGLHIPVLREGGVTFTELPDYYMGSRTQMLMNLRKNTERLTLLIPNVSVPFTRYDDGVWQKPEVYTLREDEAWVSYSVYMNGDIAETVIETGREELPDILVYGDSFTNAVECIFYNSFNTMRSLDLRHYDDMTLGDYIGLYKPDLVVCIRDYSALLSSEDNGAGAY